MSKLAFGLFFMMLASAWAETSVDTSWAKSGMYRVSGGRVIFSAPVSESLESIPLPSGKAIVGFGIEHPGRNPYSTFRIQRMNSNGTVDVSFGNSPQGGIEIEVGELTLLSKILVLSDGKVLFVGASRAIASIDTEILVGRLTADGKWDTTFAGGTGLTRVYPSDRALGPIGAALDSLGRLYVGLQVQGGNGAKVVSRFMASGLLDTSYGTSGEYIVDGDVNFNILESVKADASGRIIVLESYYDTVSALYGAALIRLDQNGVKDASFGTGGRVILPLAPFITQGRVAFPSRTYRGIILSRAGDIYAIGSNTTSAQVPYHSYVCRLTSSGALDSLFGMNGCRQYNLDYASYGVDGVETPAGFAISGGSFKVTGKNTQAGYFVTVMDSAGNSRGSYTRYVGSEVYPRSLTVAADGSLFNGADVQISSLVAHEVLKLKP